MDGVTSDPGNVQRNNEKELVSCWCRKSFKSVRGLKIHQTRKGCRRTARSAPEPSGLMQRSGADQPPGNVSDDSSQVYNHSAVDECTVDPPGARRPPIKWPSMSDSNTWSAMDEDLSAVLQHRLKGNVSNKLRCLANTVYSYGSEKFGTKVKECNSASSNLSRRQQEIHNLRKELRSLTKQWKAANKNGDVVEMAALDELRENHRRKLKSLRRAERLKRKRKERERKRARFFNNPFQFTKDIFDKAKSGTLKVSQDELEEHLKNTYCDSDRNSPMPHIDGLVHPTTPSVPFDISEPKISEIEQFLKKTRAGSSPGNNGIPYKVYRKCTKLRKILWKLLKVAWRTNIVPEFWCQAEGVYIPKEVNSEGIGCFRPISLLDVEGKLLMGVFAGRMAKYLLENGFIDTSVQKAGIPGFPGCVEHSAMIWDTIQTAKSNKQDLSVIWLDLANAYGSVPHSLISYAMEFFHIPEKLRNFVMRYYHQFKMRFTTESFTTSWQNLEVGIPMGCTISPILFVMSMEVITRSARDHGKGVEIAPGMELPPIRSFMDDLTLLIPDVEVAEIMLERLDELMSWARMKFKPKKSRSLVLRKWHENIHKLKQ